MSSLINTIGVRELQTVYATEQMGSQQVIDLVLELIAARSENTIWVSRWPDRELPRRTADLDWIRRERGTAAMPLFGAPCAVKDNIDVAGLATTAACPAFSYRPDRSAGSVARMIDAGTIVIGKTNMDQFATGLTGTRSPYGACESVFGGSRIAGTAGTAGGGLISAIPVPARPSRWPRAWCPSRWAPTLPAPGRACPEQRGW